MEENNAPSPFHVAQHPILHSPAADGTRRNKVAADARPAGILEMDYEESPDMIVRGQSCRKRQKRLFSCHWLVRIRTLVRTKIIVRIVLLHAIGFLDQKTTLVWDTWRSIDGRENVRTWTATVL
jgi:hypothetical protein